MTFFRENKKNSEYAGGYRCMKKAGNDKRKKRDFTLIGDGGNLKNDRKPGKRSYSSGKHYGVKTFDFAAGKTSCGNFKNSGKNCSGKRKFRRFRKNRGFLYRFGNSACDNYKGTHPETAFCGGGNRFNDTCRNRKFFCCRIFSRKSFFGKKREKKRNYCRRQKLRGKDHKTDFCAFKNPCANNGNQERRTRIYAITEHSCGGFAVEKIFYYKIIDVFCRRRISPDKR